VSPPNHIELTLGGYQLIAADVRGTDHGRYPLVYRVGAHKDYPSSWHSVTVIQNEEEVGTCLLIAGGVTVIHAHSAVCLVDRCYIAVGDALCAISIPALTLEWETAVDWATCFGVYHVPEYRCLISHGELEVARVNYAGKVEWRTSGRDIFSEGIAFRGQFVEATDFDKTTYRIDIETGQIVAELPSVQGA
jgi:hypothetical protein